MRCFIRLQIPTLICSEFITVTDAAPDASGWGNAKNCTFGWAGLLAGEMLKVVSLDVLLAGEMLK